MFKRIFKFLLIPPLFGLVRAILWLRYRIHTKGLSELKRYPFDTKKGILFLPNHPAEVDPVILEMLLYRHFALRPVVIEHFYYLKGFRVLMDLVGALVLPTMDEKANKWRARRIEKQFEKMVQALRSAERLLIYPAGGLKKSAEELLAGASLAYNLLQACPGTQVVLIRTTGLWGSQFSRALTGSSPNFGQALIKGFKTILKNGIFFAPRRDVHVEFEVAGADFPFQADKEQLNRYLEQWYNRYPETEEPLKLVSYAFWKQEFPQIKECVAAPIQREKKEISEPIKEQVVAFLSQLSRKPPSSIQAESHLLQDLGLDSLDMVQVALFLDEKFGIAELAPNDVQLVQDVFETAAGYKRAAKQKGEVSLPPFSWPPVKKRNPQIFEANTLQEAFLKQARYQGSQIACVDNASGQVSYQQLKLRALILARKLKNLPEEKIGILLPSSYGASLSILAVLLSGKIPVMLNWTVGVKALDHAVELTGIKHVLTSIRFLDRIQFEGLGEVEELFYFLEDLKEEVKFADRLMGVRDYLRSDRSLLKGLALDQINPSDPAVILFTSGTEALPKAVPLTHQNLLGNQRAALEAIEISSQEILYAVLPPFHSFGFSVTGLLPLMAGLRVCYGPDPTDSYALAKDIARYKPTLFCAAPSFISALFKAAKPENLHSLRLVVSGAEKAPQELFDYVSQKMPGAHIIEGYGITECSPIVTMGQVGVGQEQGVGRALPGVKIEVMDSQTQTFLPQGQEGEICISGPSVFSGYLGSSKNPFFEKDQCSWYISGDRGYLSPEGNLILTGRLKRFVKVGAEMIGLNGIEEALLEFVQNKPGVIPPKEGPHLALIAKEVEADRPELIVFAAVSVELDELNQALREKGLGRLIKVAKVLSIKTIPLMGTGKVNYRFLEEQL